MAHEENTIYAHDRSIKVEKGEGFEIDEEILSDVTYVRESISEDAIIQKYPENKESREFVDEGSLIMHDESNGDTIFALEELNEEEIEVGVYRPADE